MAGARKQKASRAAAREAILRKAAHLLKLDHDEIVREWLESLSRKGAIEPAPFPREILEEEVGEVVRGVAEVLLDAQRYRAFLKGGAHHDAAKRLARAHLQSGDSLTDALLAYMDLRQRLIRVSSDLFREADRPFFELTARIDRCLDRILFALSESYVAGFQQELERQALTDPLTGLGNWRRFREGLDRELKRSGRTRRPFAIIFLDIDDFKEMNDRLGHVMADRALQSMARVLRSQLRGSDLVCRWGGDEFIIILAETDRREAALVAEKLRVGVATDPGCLGATISVGVACYPEDGTEYDSLVGNADRALYHSKQSGKNMVTASLGSGQQELSL